MILFLAISGISVKADAGLIIKYDLSLIGLGETGIFDRQVLTTVDATSFYPLGISPGATFVDTGDLQIGSFTLGGVAVGDTEGLNSDWELTGRWDDLTGTLVSISAGYLDPDGNLDYTYTFTYTSGTAVLKADLSVDADFGSGIGSDDDDASTFTNGITLASLSLISGNAALIDYSQYSDGGYTFTKWDIVDVPSGVWLDDSGNDLEEILEKYGWVEVNTKVSTNVIVDLVNNKIHSRNDGDVIYAVPEPTTMLLLGGGLLGLAGLGIRRKKKSA